MLYRVTTKKGCTITNGYYFMGDTFFESYNTVISNNPQIIATKKRIRWLKSHSTHIIYLLVASLVYKNLYVELNMDD